MLIPTSIRKTKLTHPYNYDPFDIWNDPNVKTNASAYSDRLLQWDYKKHNELCLKHFQNEGQYWGDRKPETIQAFLRDYFDDQILMLGKITEYCNPSNGYPYWYFEFNKKEKENGKEK